MRMIKRDYSQQQQLRYREELQQQQSAATPPVEQQPLTEEEEVHEAKRQYREDQITRALEEKNRPRGSTPLSSGEIIQDAAVTDTGDIYFMAYSPAGQGRQGLMSGSELTERDREIIRAYIAEHPEAQHVTRTEDETPSEGVTIGTGFAGSLTESDKARIESERLAREAALGQSPERDMSEFVPIVDVYLGSGLGGYSYDEAAILFPETVIYPGSYAKTPAPGDYVATGRQPGDYEGTGTMAYTPGRAHVESVYWDPAAGKFIGLNLTEPTLAYKTGYFSREDWVPQPEIADEISDWVASSPENITRYNKTFPEYAIVDQPMPAAVAKVPSVNQQGIPTSIADNPTARAARASMTARQGLEGYVAGWDRASAGFAGWLEDTLGVTQARKDAANGGGAPATIYAGLLGGAAEFAAGTVNTAATFAPRLALYNRDMSRDPIGSQLATGAAVVAYPGSVATAFRQRPIETGVVLALNAVSLGYAVKGDLPGIGQGIRGAAGRAGNKIGDFAGRSESITAAGELVKNTRLSFNERLYRITNPEYMPGVGDKFEPTTIRSDIGAAITRTTTGVQNIRSRMAGITRPEYMPGVGDAFEMGGGRLREIAGEVLTSYSREAPESYAGLSRSPGRAPAKVNYNPGVGDVYQRMDIVGPFRTAAGAAGKRVGVIVGEVAGKRSTVSGGADLSAGVSLRTIVGNMRMGDASLRNTAMSAMGRVPRKIGNAVDMVGERVHDIRNIPRAEGVGDVFEPVKIGNPTRAIRTAAGNVKIRVSAIRNPELMPGVGDTFEPVRISEPIKATDARLGKLIRAVDRRVNPPSREPAFIRAVKKEKLSTKMTSPERMSTATGRPGTVQVEKPVAAMERGITSGTAASGVSMETIVGQMPSSGKAISAQSIKVINVEPSARVAGPDMNKVLNGNMELVTPTVNTRDMTKDREFLLVSDVVGLGEKTKNQEDTGEKTGPATMTRLFEIQGTRSEESQRQLLKLIAPAASDERSKRKRSMDDDAGLTHKNPLATPAELMSLFGAGGQSVNIEKIMRGRI
jgi:hypothetical protein